MIWSVFNDETKPIVQYYAKKHGLLPDNNKNVAQQAASKLRCILSMMGMKMNKLTTAFVMLSAIFTDDGDRYSRLVAEFL